MFERFISPFLDAVMGKLIAPLLERIPKWALVTLAATVIAAAVFAIGFAVGGHRAEPASASGSPASTSIGGLDLQQYCVSYGYDHVEGQSCQAAVDLGKACDWQYKQSGLHLTFSMNDPYSGMCFTPDQNAKGGIRDMLGYCRVTFPTSNEVRPAVVDRMTWVCQAPIDMQIACIWQYQSPKMEARKEGGTWICVK
ncbi:hypothetical protein [Nocardia tengchongensis]